MKKNNTTIIAEPGKLELIVTREFEAPRELVFKALTDPKLVVQWLGPRDIKMRIEKYEAKPGGTYRYVHFRSPEEEYSFYGVFHECTAPELIIQTFEFEGLPEKGHVCLETMRLEALPGNRTRMTAQDLFQTVTDRDTALQSGMEGGIIESYERLDEMFEKSLVK